jgi:hypothetical protein
MKIYEAVQKLFVGDRQTETGDLISLLSFLEIRLNIGHLYHSIHIATVLYIFLK